MQEVSIGSFIAAPLPQLPVAPDPPAGAASMNVTQPLCDTAMYAAAAAIAGDKPQVAGGAAASPFATPAAAGQPKTSPHHLQGLMEYLAVQDTNYKLGRQSTTAAAPAGHLAGATATPFGVCNAMMVDGPNQERPQQHGAVLAPAHAAVKAAPAAGAAAAAAHHVPIEDLDAAILPGFTDFSHCMGSVAALQHRLQTQSLRGLGVFVPTIPNKRCPDIAAEASCWGQLLGRLHGQCMHMLMPGGEVLRVLAASACPPAANQARADSMHVCCLLLRSAETPCGG
jgi:hypothetical protein